ncbi:MAG: hypothetical protein ABIF71_15000 [Planctomycetota bacterium]
MKKIAIVGICVLAAIVVMAVFHAAPVLSQDQAPEPVRRVTLELEMCPVSYAVKQLNEVTGFDIVVGADVLSYCAKENIEVHLTLREAYPMDAIFALAAHLGLVAEPHGRIVYIKWRPDPKEAVAVGQVVIKEKDCEITLTIYDGDIPYELKQRVVSTLLERNLRRTDQDRQEQVKKAEKAEKPEKAEKGLNPEQKEKVNKELQKAAGNDGKKQDAPPPAAPNNADKEVF